MLSPGFLLAAVLLLPSISVEAYQPAVYVTFDKDEGIPRDRRRDIADSARDVREKMRDKHGVELLDSEERAKADVIVTILDRRIEVNPTGVNDWGGALQQTHYQSRYFLSFRFESRAAIYESEIVLAGAFVTWKRMASELAKDAEDWARENATDED